MKDMIEMMLMRIFVPRCPAIFVELCLKGEKKNSFVVKGKRIKLTVQSLTLNTYLYLPFKCQDYKKERLILLFILRNSHEN